MFDAGSSAHHGAPAGALVAGSRPHGKVAPIAACDWDLLFHAAVERLGQCLAEPGPTRPAARAAAQECLVALQRLQDSLPPQRRPGHPPTPTAP